MPGERILVVDDCRAVREITSAILARGGFEPVPAADGAAALELARRAPPDLILVDFIMPKMNGLKLCQLLRGIEELRAVPIVLVSVKADSVGDKFRELVGVCDTVAKPFTPETLLGVVGRRLRERAAAADAAAGGAARGSQQDPLAPQAGPGGPARLRAKIAGLLARRAGGGTPAEAPARAARIGGLVDEALDDATLRILAHDFGNVYPLAGAAALAGSSDAITVGEVIQVLAQGGKSGMLKVAAGRVRAEICLRGGKVHLARMWGGPDEFFLGRYLLKGELVRRETIDRLVREPTPGLLLGESIVKEGLVTLDRVERALEEQTTEIIYEVLSWDSCTYSFLPGVFSHEAKASPISADAGELLMNGFQRVDEWKRIRKELPDLDAVLAGEGGERAGSGGEEEIVRSFIDGRRTLREICRETSLSSFDVCRAALALLERGAARKVRS